MCTLAQGANDVSDPYQGANCGGAASGGESTFGRQGPLDMYGAMTQSVDKDSVVTRNYLISEAASAAVRILPGVKIIDSA